MFGKSFASRTRIRMAAPTAMTVVAVTITAAAARTVGARRMKRDIWRSRRLLKGILTLGTVRLHAHRVVAAVDVEGRRGHVLRVLAQQIGGSRSHIVGVDVAAQRRAFLDD